MVMLMVMVIGHNDCNDDYVDHCDDGVHDYDDYDDGYDHNDCKDDYDHVIMMIDHNDCNDNDDDGGSCC